MSNSKGKAREGRDEAYEKCGGHGVKSRIQIAGLEV
jgi:hypothetical protein